MFLDKLIYILKCTACFTGIFVLLSLCVNIVRNGANERRKQETIARLEEEIIKEALKNANENNKEEEN